MKKKFSFLFILLFLIFILCLSCSPRKSNQIKISFWQFWTDPEIKPVLTELISDFEKENPGIKVEVTDLTWANGHEKIAVAFATNSAPDVLELGSDWVPEFASQGVLAEMTEEVSSFKDLYLMWEPVSWNDKIFGFPWILDTRVLFFNKELLGNNVPATWKELLQSCQKINNPTRGIFGFGANSKEKHRLYKKFLPFFWSNGGNLISADGKNSEINSPDGKEALQFYVQLVKNSLIETQKNLEEAFLQGKIGFVISGGWLLKEIKKRGLTDRFGVTLIPEPDKNKGERISFAGGEFLVINKKSLHKEAAVKFILFLTQKENLLKFCRAIGSTFPSSREAFQDSFYQNDPNLQIFKNQLEKAYSSPFHPKWVYLEEILETAIEEAMFEKKTPARALDEAKKKMDLILQKQE